MRGSDSVPKGVTISIKKSRDASNLGWFNDGKEGKNDLNTSEQILVQWISKWENYNRYRSGNGGVTKLKLCDEVLVPLLKSNEVRVARTGKQVYDKIQWFETKFRDALMWGDQTGVGVKENEGDLRFNELLEQRCPHYFELYPVFSERAGMKPKLTSDQVGDDDEDEDDDSTDSDGADKELDATNKSSFVRIADSFYLCQCKHDRYACEDCSTGWGKKQQQMLDSGDMIRKDGMFLVNPSSSAAAVPSLKRKDCFDSDTWKSPNARPQKSPRGQNSSSKKKSRRTTSTILTDLISLKVEQYKGKKEKASYVSADIQKKVALAKNFKDMSDSLGDRVQAVKVVPEFKIFLNAAELNELDEIERGIV